MVSKVKGEHLCGWCITLDHENCIGYIKHYDTVYVCKCAEAECGATSTKYTAKFGDAGAEQPKEKVEPPDVQVVEGETVLLDESVKDGGTGAIGPVAKSNRRGRKPKTTTDSTG